jgi:hypothetical protein
MNNKIGAYSFFPWLRQGIANSIKTQDLDTNVKVRASVNIALLLKGKGIGGTNIESPISNNVAIYGPGDIIGIDSKAIIKTEPRNWITNFEPNYLPYIEFYDEDFPWRYTPAAPDSTLGRLRPWIMLVVLKEDEFKDGGNITNKPLPYINILNDANHIFPPTDQLWAWVHVHINEDIVNLDSDIENSDLNTIIPRFRDILSRNPDLAYSRIVCPRKLTPNTPYHAFLIPVFESGRLAGLGYDPDDILNAPLLHATYSAWEGYSGKVEEKNFPYYHRWYFRTSAVGDFEYLVRLLEHKPVDSRVGRRDIDVQDPGSNVIGITDEKLAGILKLGGALQVPFNTMSREDKLEVLKYENWDRLDQLDALSKQDTDKLLDKDTAEKVNRDKPHNFQKELAAFINLADDYSKQEVVEAHQNSSLNEAISSSSEIDDPLITPPLYGQWHIMVQRLLEEKSGIPISPSENWIHELNLDPRWRVAAGFGTKVIQDKQEEYMAAAWGQVGEILEANRKIRLAQLAKQASRVFYDKHIKPINKKNAETTMALTSPVQKRILAQGVTVYHQINSSRVPYAVVSTPMRRAIRPRSRMMRSLSFTDKIQPQNLISRINKEEVYPAPPKITPTAIPTLNNLSNNLKPRNVPNIILDLLSKYPWLQYLPLFLAAGLIILFFVISTAGISLPIISTAFAGSLYLYNVLRKLTKQVKNAKSVLEKNQTPESVDKMPHSPNFRITAIGEGFKPNRGATDSSEATRFKSALRNTYELAQLSGQAGTALPEKELNVKLITDKIINDINPDITIPKMVLNSICIPAHIINLIGTDLNEIMAYPEFDFPMYKPLVDISTELFLPNINYISQNCISLLETNQPFIESYLVGLNHEFSRELLWREYPTDQRGSYFRQFWDASSCLDTTASDPEILKEKLRDIPPLHRWKPPSESPTAMLGDHDNRAMSGEKKEEVVLVIRGELLKKYPTAVIYAHRAQWQMKNGKIDNKKVRLLVDLAGNDLINPPREILRTPLYEAKVEPDIYFFGFDLTIDEAIGGTGEKETDDPGWFFIIKERPGEPRFGLDIEKSTKINVWNDLSWEDLGVTDNNFININNNTPTITLNNPSSSDDQQTEDMHLSWNKSMNAAEVAYILYQVPVLIAVHASEMLPKK